MSSDAHADVDDLELQKTLDRKRTQLEVVAHRPETKSWLGPCASSEEGTTKLLEELERRVDRDDFVDALSEERRQQESSPAPSTATTGVEVLAPEWWEAVPAVAGTSVVSEATGDYVIVEHSDVVDALAAFLAAYIVALPEGAGMEPKQLQRAVKQSLQEIRKGKVRKLWDWGRFLYRAAAMSYGAFAAYTNPWIAEAVLRGLFTCARFATKFW